MSIQNGAPGTDVQEIDDSAYAEGQGSIIGAFLGITQKGPVDQAVLVTSWAQFKSVFGDLLAGSYLPIEAKLLLDAGGEIYVVRVTSHSAGVSTALPATIMLQTSGGGATAATIVGTVAGTLWQGNRTWPFQNTAVISVKTENNPGFVTSTISSSPAATSLTNSATFALSDGMTLLYRVGPATNPVRTLTFHAADFVSIGAATPTEIDKVFARDLRFLHSSLVGNLITLSTDEEGTAARLEFVTGGTALSALGLSVAVYVGSGNVADVNHVTAAEINALVSSNTLGLVTFSVNSSGYGVLTRTTAGATNTLQIALSGTAALGAASLGLSDTTVHAGTSSSPVNTLLVSADSPGTWGNNLTVDTMAATLATTTKFRLVVKYSGTVVRDEDELSFDPTDARYVGKVFPGGNGTWISVVDELAQAGGLTYATAVPAFATGQAVGTTQSGTDGLVGIGDTDYAGDSTLKTGLHALDGRSDVWYVGAPGNTSRTWLGLLQAWVEPAKVFWLADVPLTLTPQQTSDFRMGAGAYAGGSGMIASTWGALYANWTGILDPLTKVEIFVPPMWKAAAAYVNTAVVAEPWFAPAGAKRAKVTGITRLYQQLSDADVGVIYKAGVNPLALNSRGIAVVDGQRTLAGTASALDRINVRFLLMYLERTIAPAIDDEALWEPNDAITWLALTGLVTPVIDRVKAGRGVYDARFVCDATTNTSDTIAQKQLVAELFVKPTITAEWIKFKVIAVGQNVDISEQAA